jgi:vacuolar-type H+-ATPase subunit E/Vma4
MDKRLNGGTASGSASGSSGGATEGAADGNAVRIVAGILADAEAEAARIVAEADAYGVGVAERAAAQAATIEREAAAKADALAAGIALDAQAKAAMERRRNALLLQESLASGIVLKAEKALGMAMGQSGYRDTLRRWIVEAAIGLSSEAATVNASMHELPLIDEALLREAEAEVLASTGKATRLSRLDGDPLTGQGVYLVAGGGRLAYDNTITTRLERRRTEIRKLIHKALFDSRSA